MNRLDDEGGMKPTDEQFKSLFGEPKFYNPETEAKGAADVFAKIAKLAAGMKDAIPMTTEVDLGDGEGFSSVGFAAGARKDDPEAKRALDLVMEKHVTDYKRDLQDTHVSDGGITGEVHGMDVAGGIVLMVNDGRRKVLYHVAEGSDAVTRIGPVPQRPW